MKKICKNCENCFVSLNDFKNKCDLDNHEIKNEDEETCNDFERWDK